MYKKIKCKSEYMYTSKTSHGGKMEDQVLSLLSKNYSPHTKNLDELIFNSFEVHFNELKYNCKNFVVK